MTKTFTAFDAAGTVIYKGRGKLGAAQKACDAIHDYRDAVRAGSGRLYGNPSEMGRVEVDGVVADDLECTCGETLLEVRAPRAAA